MTEQIDMFNYTEGIGQALVSRAVDTGMPRRWRHGRSVVPAWAADRALNALQVFNTRAGTRLSAFRHDGRPSEHLTRVTGAVLDHSDVTDEQWAAVVEATLAAPWWQGPPSVGVVFGPAVVDKNIAIASGQVAVARQTSNGSLLRALSS